MPCSVAKKGSWRIDQPWHSALTVICHWICGGTPVLSKSSAWEKSAVCSPKESPHVDQPCCTLILDSPAFRTGLTHARWVPCHWDTPPALKLSIHSAVFPKCSYMDPLIPSIWLAWLLTSWKKENRNSSSCQITIMRHLVSLLPKGKYIWPSKQNIQRSIERCWICQVLQFLIHLP